MLQLILTVQKTVRRQGELQSASREPNQVLVALVSPHICLIQKTQKPAARLLASCKFLEAPGDGDEVGDIQ